MICRLPLAYSSLLVSLDAFAVLSCEIEPVPEGVLGVLDDVVDVGVVVVVVFGVVEVVVVVVFDAVAGVAELYVPVVPDWPVGVPGAVVVGVGLNPPLWASYFDTIWLKESVICCSVSW
jgi:hypothetical protein